MVGRALRVRGVSRARDSVGCKRAYAHEIRRGRQRFVRHVSQLRACQPPARTLRTLRRGCSAPYELRMTIEPGEAARTFVFLPCVRLPVRWHAWRCRKGMAIGNGVHAWWWLVSVQTVLNASDGGTGVWGVVL